MTRGKRRGQQRDRRQTYRDCADSDPALESFAQFAQFLLEAAIVGEHTMCPTEHAFTLGGEAHKALTTFNDQNAELSQREVMPHGAGGQ